jgi:phage-related protein
MTSEHWSVETLDAMVDAEIAALPGDLRARLSRIGSMIEELGLERLRDPYVRHLEGPLWEIRLRGRDRIARALYVTAGGRRVIIVRAFVKKTQKTPRREVELALTRARRVSR